MKPKVLIGTVTYEGKDYCFDKFLENLKKISYENYDFIIIDNSKTDEYYKKLKSLGLNAFRTPRGNNSREAIAFSMNFMRDYFLKGKYDYLLTLESDLFPNAKVIDRLIAYGAPVVGSFYLIGHKEDDKIFYDIIEKTKQGELRAEDFEKNIRGLQPRRACIFVARKNKNTGEVTIKNIGAIDTPKIYKTGLQKITGVGFGCTLIRREIVEQYTFWFDGDFGTKHPDVYFYMELHNDGIPVFVDTNHNIKHLPSRWSLVEDM